MYTDTETRLNASSVQNILSGLVDGLQWAADEARGAGLHGMATELETHRDAIAEMARRTWREEGGER